MQSHVLDEPVRPAAQLRRHQGEGAGLDRVAHRLGHEAHRVASLIQAPRQVHVLGHRAIGPTALLPQDGRAVHREAARGDERLAVVLLQPLVEGEGEQVLDVAPPLPHAAHALRQHEPARRRDLRSLERREQPLEGVRREHRVGIDRDGEQCADATQPEALRARLGPGVVRRPDDRHAQRAGHVAGAVRGAVVHHDDFERSFGLSLEAADRVGHARRLVVGGDDDRHVGAGQSPVKPRARCGRKQRWVPFGCEGGLDCFPA